MIKAHLLQVCFWYKEQVVNTNGYNSVHYHKRITKNGETLFCYPCVVLGVV